MSSKKAHKKIGPGGIKCPCCQPMETIAKSKRYVNRTKRRASRQEFRGASFRASYNTVSDEIT